MADPAVGSGELAWSIASPPLLTAAVAPHRVFSAAECAALWQAWQPPSPEPGLLPHRLGRRFEALWQHWLHAHPRWQLLANGLQVTQQHQTIGEFDLLVRDRQNADVEHWELAVKFYFGDGLLDDPACWWGVSRQDRLDRKLLKLQQQQLCLAATDAGQSALQTAGIHVTATRAVVKGRLFYPLASSRHHARFAAPGHLRGTWASAVAWLAWCHEHGDVPVSPYPREQWLQSPPVVADRQAFTACLQALGNDAFACFQCAAGRVMAVLPATWAAVPSREL
ncbi:MAG TPA: DUF1853 family protein [Permianibacter sp.]|nr:DUF1853 family protein [Permianibacter sp.]